MTRDFPTPDALATAMAARVAAALAADIAATGTATLAVSGGTTPRRFFQALSQTPLAWAQVTVILVDERCVPETSPRSNTALVRAHLLQGPAAAARFVPLTSLLPPLTVAVLGMGLDGHTASFFPGGDNLAAALDPTGTAASLPMTAPGADEPRLTLTLPVLARAKHLLLHIEGSAKRAVLENAQNLPIHAVLTARPDIEIFWSP